MNDEKNLAWPVYLVLLAVVSFQILYGIGGLALLDPDEPVYAETAKEMIRFGDYLSPRIYTEIWYDKPPIFHWLIVVSLKMFGGFSELAARLPASFMAIGSALLTALASARLFGARTGFWSGMITGTSVFLMYMGKASVTDTTLLFFMTAALFSFIHRQYWLMYFCCGLAVMTKGPIGIVFPGAIVFFYLLLTRQLERLFHMHVVRGVLLAALVGMPWYIYMYTVHGMPFIHDFIGFHNISRFAHPLHPVRDHWYFYIPVVLLGFFPWTGLLIQSVKNAYRRSFGEEAELLTFFQVWWIFVLIFFSFAQTKQVSYMLILVPPLATVIASSLPQMLDYWLQTPLASSVRSPVLVFVSAFIWLLAGDSLPRPPDDRLRLRSMTCLPCHPSPSPLYPSHRPLLTSCV